MNTATPSLAEALADLEASLTRLLATFKKANADESGSDCA